ncbi:MAG TPA: DUF1254 domain-containing protein, partial [Candidatus Limnocylindrales bacterium]|nr:DUF1254 domain-containing protein [Candidatus Limnocylindrales bacterium]
MTNGADDRRELVEAARDAYVLFFPMLMGYRYLFGGFLVPQLPSHRAPLNTLGGKPRTLDHTFREVITPNADTPYSMAALDLRAEPMVLSVPAVTDRFYHFQLEDLWGQNVHYVGVRATGTGPGTYLIAGPGWEGDAPADVDAVLRFETDVVFIIGRTQLLGADDVETLGAIMAAYDLRPLSTHTGGPAPIQEPFAWPVWNDEASRDERFIGYANALLPLCRPFHDEDVPHLERFARIGIGAGQPFDTEALDEGTRSAIRAGVAEARAAIEARVGALGRKANGWGMTEVFGDRAWYGGDYLLRAAGAMIGWGGNDVSEALYPLAREDADGEPLRGDRRYRIRMTSLPPAKAFWSVTMYDTSYDGVAGYLVENPIDRYLINPTTQGLVRAEGGSLTI